jgi:hypothetical protein
MFKIVLKRFLKGFLAGGLAQVALVAGGGLTINNLADIKNVSIVLLAAFITGGLLGLQKLYTYQE